MKRLNHLVVLLVISCLLPTLGWAQMQTLSGYVRETGKEELLVGVSVQVVGTTKGTTTNGYGHYTMVLPRVTDSLTVLFSMVGYESVSRRVATDQPTRLSVALPLQPRLLTEVQVRSSAQTEVSSTIVLPIRQVKEVAALLGEKDVMKVLQLLPGVQKGNEGQTGLYVRGGGPDQNLIILDDAVVYNANHLFGFFSTFNTDALKNVELIKGGFPAQYGGRLSSVVNLQMKEGARDKLHGEGGVGLIASRLTLEGPLRRDRSSFLISARRTYADALLRPLLGNSLPALYFYDLNAKVNYDLNARNRLFVSGYFGQDAAKFTSKATDGGGSEDGFAWGNATATLRWNHVAGDRLFVNTSLIYSQYQFRVYSDQSGLQTGNRYLQQYSSGIRDLTAKTDIDWVPSTSVSLKMGVKLTSYLFTPSAFVSRNLDRDSIQASSQSIRAIEGGLYADAQLRLIDRLRLNVGLRLSAFAVNQRQYWRPEPRLSAAYTLPADWTLKASYARMNQYIHLLTNSGLGLPTDLWVPATDQIQPQTTWQVTAGVSKVLPTQKTTLSVEAYYKELDQIIGYKEGATFLLLDTTPNPNRVAQVDWQSNVTTGRGRSYGLEVLLHRTAGRLNGWIGYTLSWTKHQFAELNGGQEFYAHHDRRHDLSVVSLYHIKPKLDLSLTWVYGTGNALTIPTGTAVARGNSFLGGIPSQTTVDLYGERNNFRAAPYHRLDVALRFHKVKRWGERIWEVGAYNAYNRINPFYYTSRTASSQTTTDPTRQVFTRRGIFPIVPMISYAFSF